MKPRTLTPNQSLKTFCTRAQAFLSNDYYASDVAWMKLDAPIDVTIGPYETYNDDLFGYKAAFEAYVTLRDEQETAKLKMFADHIQEIENNLPLDAKYRNPKLGALAPIRVVNQIAGDRRWRAWRPHGRLQSAQRRAHRQGHGLETGDAEERPGGQVREDSGAHRRRVLAPRGPQRREVRRVLHAYPGA